MPGRDSVTGRVALEARAVHVSDVLADPEYGATQLQKLGGYRTILGVPMLREGAPVGVFALTRSEVRDFTPTADRARRDLRRPGRHRHRECAAVRRGAGAHRASCRARSRICATAQDRLVQTEKLASLGQLTAGIAHEIKNPLNFVNNFSALSGELIDELREVACRARRSTASCATRSPS